MKLAVRSFLLCLAAVAVLAASGCGNKLEVRTQGETEGSYLTVGNLKYQVQISRILNPADVGDQGFLRGVSQGVAPDEDEVWFGVFIQVQNEADRTLTPANEFVIEDTTGKRYTPLNLDERVNVFAYKPNPLPGGGLIPAVGSPAYDNSIQGALLLFKLHVGSLYNRPVELRISSSQGGDVGSVDLDI